MANYVGLTRHVWAGRGHAARAVGVPYNVYRITSASNGNYIDTSNKISTDFYVLAKVHKDGTYETPLDMKTMFFNFVGDTTTFDIGDVFILNDPVYGTGDQVVDFPTQQFRGMCLAYNPPISKLAVAARVDRLAQIYRPAPGIDSTGYWSQATDNALPLIMNAGQFDFSAAPGAVATMIPVGLVPFPRPSGGAQFKPDLPGTLEFPSFFIYTPPLEGVHLREGDRIVDQSGARYVVMVPWIQEAAISGNQLGCRRVNAGGTP
jgi:hypothetical protein